MNNLSEKVARRADIANYGTGMEGTKKSAKAILDTRLPLSLSISMDM